MENLIDNQGDFTINEKGVWMLQAPTTEGLLDKCHEILCSARAYGYEYQAFNPRYK